MKRLILFCSLLSCSAIVLAQSAPQLTREDGEYQLFIPYFEFGDKAYEVELFTPDDSDELIFEVDFDSLLPLDREAGPPLEEIDEDEGACSSTSSAAFLACRAQVEDEYFLGLGTCFNVANSLNRSFCKEEVESEMEEALEECGEQEEARAQVCLAVGEEPYEPDIDPENFLSPAQIAADPNPWFPLVPGNQWIYEAEDETVTVTVTGDTREIMGITAVVVRDVVEEEGELVEDTDDWFAQDVDGNVWYMGEISRNYEDGRLSDVEGSWEAGKDGARAGILFRAEPMVGETLRQEFLLGEAEDMGTTLSLTAEAESEALNCDANCLKVLEFTPLEPGVEEQKFYYPGVGNILTIDLETGETEELVDYSVQ